MEEKCGQREKSKGEEKEEEQEEKKRKAEDIDSLTCRDTYTKHSHKLHDVHSSAARERLNFS